jgi:glycopeptide antibiotics resistance protein
MTAGLHHTGHPHGSSLAAFSPSLRLAWVAIAALTVLAELIPFPPIVPPPLFYSYKAAKILLFLILGYMAPLTFWRFNSLTLGVVFAAISAALVESLQGLPHGHRFSWFELIAKLCLIFVGFAFALDARYERVIRLGPLRVALVGPHLPPRE